MMKPLFTEKTLTQAQKGRFTFAVSKNLGKFQIKTLVEETFNVHVTRVATANFKALTRRTNKGTKVTTAAWKKAIVSLKKGEVIDLFVQAKQTKKEKTAKTKKA